MQLTSVILSIYAELFDIFSYFIYYCVMQSLYKFIELTEVILPYAINMFIALSKASKVEIFPPL